jgi:hypothetical protein
MFNTLERPNVFAFALALAFGLDLKLSLGFLID